MNRKITGIYESEKARFLKENSTETKDENTKLVSVKDTHVIVKFFPLAAIDTANVSSYETLHVLS